MTLRDNVIAAAARLIATEGWHSVTMSRLASELGVSRQTVYNEVGSKPRLAEAVVQAELERFLQVVTSAFDDHPDQVLTAIHTAVLGVLDLAQDNALLHAVVSATHGADTELLPLLTTHADGLLTTAKTLVSQRLRNYALPTEETNVDIAVDVLVRHVLSHVTQPTATPAETADAVTWAAARLLA